MTSTGRVCIDVYMLTRNGQVAQDVNLLENVSVSFVIYCFTKRDCILLRVAEVEVGIEITYRGVNTSGDESVSQGVERIVDGLTIRLSMCQPGCVPVVFCWSQQLRLVFLEIGDHITI